MLLHGSCVALGDAGLLLLAPPGGGKSDLALRLLGRGGVLVADDQVELTRIGNALFAQPAPGLAGRLEVRGLGVIDRVAWREAPVALAVELVPLDQVPRLPAPAWWEALGIIVPLLRLHAFAASAPDVLAAALATLDGRYGMMSGAFAA